MSLAAGLPVVNTVVNGAADLIEDGVNGFLLQRPDDAARLASLIGTLLDAGLRRRIGTAARATAERADIAENCKAVEAVLLACHANGRA